MTPPVDLDTILDEQQALFEIDQSIVWHHTNTAGLLGIIKDKQLWATAITALNDTREFELGAELVRDVFSRNLRDGEYAKEDPRILDELRALVDGLQHYADGSLIYPRPQVYVTSATTEKDSLSNWRGYGTGDVQYAIGLDRRVQLSPITQGRRQLVEANTTLPPEAQIPLYKPSVSPWTDVRYLDRSHIDEDHWILGQIANIISSYRLSILSEDGSAPQGESFSEFAATLKDYGFRDESEARLFVFDEPPYSIEPEFRPGRFGVTPYVRVGCVDESGTTQHLPIVSIMVGPSPHGELHRQNLERYLETHGLRASIQVSGVPFRN